MCDYEIKSEKVILFHVFLMKNYDEGIKAVIKKRGNEIGIIAMIFYNNYKKFRTRESRENQSIKENVPFLH